MKASIGIIGLAVMGENLALNMESKVKLPYARYCADSCVNKTVVLP